MPRKDLINEVGNVYGLLTVMDRAENHITHKANGKISTVSMWVCRCSCGNITIVRGRSLRTGRTKSCGHLHKFEKGEAAFNSFYGKCKESAIKRNYIWNLSKEQVREITSQNCYYCGRKPSQSTKTPKGEYIYNGIDRIDNSIGYQINNIVPCCKHCNYAKRTMSLNEFKSWIMSIYEHLIK